MGQNGLFWPKTLLCLASLSASNALGTGGAKTCKVKQGFWPKVHFWISKCCALLKIRATFRAGHERGPSKRALLCSAPSGQSARDLNLTRDKSATQIGTLCKSAKHTFVYFALFAMLCVFIRTFWPKMCKKCKKYTFKKCTLQVGQQLRCRFWPKSTTHFCTFGQCAHWR